MGAEVPMSVRKRSWKTSKGEQKEAWVVDYVDQAGKRHLKTFSRKKDADAYRVAAGFQISQGTHTADSQSITVAEAAGLWLISCESSRLERATIDGYRQHVELHMVPLIGRLKLA